MPQPNGSAISSAMHIHEIMPTQISDLCSRTDSGTLDSASHASNSAENNSHGKPSIAYLDELLSPQVMYARMCGVTLLISPPLRTVFKDLILSVEEAQQILIKITSPPVIRIPQPA